MDIAVVSESRTNSGKHGVSSQMVDSNGYRRDGPSVQPTHIQVKRKETVHFDFPLAKVKYYNPVTRISGISKYTTENVDYLH